MRKAIGFAVSLALGACGGGAGQDLVTYVGSTFSVGAPRGWEVCSRPGESGEGTASVVMSGPRGTQEFPPFIQVTDEGTERTFEHAVRFQELLLSLTPGYRKISEEPTEVDGAEDAVAIRFSQQYPSTGPGEPAVPVSGRLVTAAGPGGDIVTLTAVSHTKDAARFQASIEAAVDSLEVGGEGTEGTRVDRLPAC